MLFFGLSFAASVVALLGVQKMDIECVSGRKAKWFAPSRKADMRVLASAGAVSGAI